MSAARLHMAALNALYRPSPTELRDTAHDGLVEALRQLDGLRTDEDLDQLLGQLHGIARTAGRLRGQLAQGVPHAPAA